MNQKTRFLFQVGLRRVGLRQVLQSEKNKDESDIFPKDILKDSKLNFKIQRTDDLN